MRWALILSLAVMAASAHAQSSQTLSDMARHAMSAAECEAIPEGAGTYALFFNPAGQQQSYYRSQCYFRLAQDLNDPELCALVRQKRTLFGGDGGYYSPGNCLRRLERRAEQAALQEVDPGAAFRLSTITADMNAKDPRFIFHLSKTGISGLYRVGLTLDYLTPDGARATAAINPSDPRIRFVTELEEFGPQIRGWVAEIDKDDRHVEYTVAPRHLEDARQAQADGRIVTATAVLALIRPDDRTMRDPDPNSRDYWSEFTFVLPKVGEDATMTR